MKPKRVKKVQKEHFYPFFGFLIPDLRQKVIQNFKIFSYMTTRVKYRITKFGDDPTGCSQLNDCRGGQSMGFWNFSIEKGCCNAIN